MPLLSSPIRIRRRGRLGWLGWGRGKLAWGGSGGCGRVGEQVDEPHDCLLVALDSGAFVVGERDLHEHPLDAGLRLEQLPFG